MPEYTIYRQDTGEIVCSGFTFAETVEIDGEVFIDGVFDGATHYVVSGVATERPENPATISRETMVADGIDTVTISGLPDGCVIACECAEHVVTDGEFSFSVPIPGVYRLVAELFPYKQKTWEVTAG